MANLPNFDLMLNERQDKLRDQRQAHQREKRSDEFNVNRQLDGYHFKFDKKALLKKKRSVIPIKNEDKTCLARAIVVGRFHCQKPRNPDKMKNWKRYWNTLRKGDDNRCTLQRREAHALMKQAGCEQESGPKEWQRFQTALLPHYRLKIYGLDPNAKRMKLNILYSGEGTGASVHILYGDHHYDCITSYQGSWSIVTIVIIVIRDMAI